MGLDLCHAVENMERRNRKEAVPEHSSSREVSVGQDI